MVPLYAHRYLPAGEGTWGHPVLSIWGTDVIYYGADLLHYIGREFDRDDDPDVDSAPWPEMRRPFPATSWVRLADWSQARRPIPPGSSS